MQRKIEKEYKYLLSVEQFQKALTRCNMEYSFLGCKLQANYYYDTDTNALNKNEITVRIRQHHNDMRLQIKKHNGINGAQVISNEYSSAKIGELPYLIKISGVQSTIKLKGVLFTERTIYRFGSCSTICFDKNMYLGICDYEIEIEVGENDEGSAQLVIEFLDLVHKPVRNKSSRFLEQMEQLKLRCAYSNMRKKKILNNSIILPI